MTVHLQTCPTVVNEREVSRLIEVEWEAAPTQTYPIAIRVEAYDRTGLLSDITQVVAENKVNIVAADVGVTPDHTAVVTATLQVASVSPAGPGHEPDRAAQGRHQRPARPRLARPGHALRPLDFGAMPTFRAPRGTRDLLPAETPAWTRLERLAADLAARYGYRRIETPLFEQTGGLRAGHRRGHRRRREGAVPARAADRGGRGVGAPAGADRRDRPGLRPARDADLAAAGEADDDRADVPLRPAAGRPVPPVLAVRHRGDRRPGPGDRRRDHRARRRASTATPGWPASRSCSTRSATRPAGRPTSPS